MVRRLAALALAGLLAACGGSGGGGTPATAISSGGGVNPNVITQFPLRAAYKAYLVDGYTQQFSVSGDCNGTETQQSSKPVASTFGQTAAYAITVSDSLVLRDCAAATTTQSTSVQYFDDQYRALGAVTPGGGGVAKYDVAVTMPELVQVGDKGVLGVERLYSDAGATIPAGRTVLSYSIAADSASTASSPSVLTLFTAETYDLFDRLTVTQTATYRLGALATFKVVSIDARYPTGNVLHLVLTPQ